MPSYHTDAPSPAAMKHFPPVPSCLLCVCPGLLTSLATAEADQYKADKGDNRETGASWVSLWIQ